MKILYVTSEAAPFYKTGGLGDVMGALPRAVAAKRHDTRVIMPLYGSLSEEWRAKLKFIKFIYVRLAWRSLYCGLFELKIGKVTYYFLDNEYYFKRGELYGSFDDGERFSFFSKAVVDILPQLGWTPNVVHCNDWQTALVPVYLRTEYLNHEGYRDIKSVFTIHNIEYQGCFSSELMTDIFGLPLDLVYHGTMEYRGGVSLMKGAIHFADAVTAVSPTYAEELRYPFYAKGFEGVINAHRVKLSGILNGLDTQVYDPATDTNLAANYDVATLEKKAENKRDLQRLLGLDERPDTPLIGMVSRLVAHKGLDLVAASLDALMDMDVQLVALGRGDWHFEQLFANAARNYPNRVSANILYNNSLAQKIYAGSDIFLMPSQSEPCGLSQMIAMRYGTLPLVRETGGLKDTVFPYIAESGEGNGFTFANYNADDMMYVLRKACHLYTSDKEAWRKLQTTGMKTDFSWKNSAAKYTSLYNGLVKPGKK